MITAGVDAGIEYVKIAIISDGKIIGQGKALSGGACIGASARHAWDEALKTAGISACDVPRVVATGKGKYDVDFANDRYTEPVAAARSARFVCPDATAVVDIGADETLVVTLGRERIINEMAINQKCSAGLGIFLKHMARRLELSLEEMSSLPISESHEAVVSDGCVVFAELDALSLLNRGVPPREVAVALIHAVAVRANSVINDITVPATERVVLVGGMAKNTAFVKALKARSNIDFIIPEDAEYAGAIGAALIAAD